MMHQLDMQINENGEYKSSCESPRCGAESSGVDVSKLLVRLDVSFLA